MPSNIKFDVFSLFGMGTKQPIVEARIADDTGEMKIQMTPNKAREIGQILMECAESAESDAFMYRYFTTHGLEEEKVAQVLDDFRRERVVFNAEQTAHDEG